MKRNKAKLGWVLAVGMLATSLAQAQVAGAGAQRNRVPTALDPVRDQESRKDGTYPGVDLSALKTQIETFQAVVNQDIAQALPQPFVLLQDTKGTYLPRFGVVFHLEVNLHPLRVLNMFSFQPYTEEELEKVKTAKIERIGELKTRLSALLLEHGTKLAAVPADENVAVVVHLFNMPSEKREGLPTQLVMETSRRSLTEAAAKRMPAAEFEKQQTFLEF